MCVAGLMLLRDSCYFVIVNGITGEKQVISKIEDINNIGDMGGYISERNKTTSEALECSMTDDGELNCDFRILRPDDGTKAVWIFDHNETDSSRWNLIISDNLKEFVAGFDFICKLFGVDMWNYILGRPIESEGGVANWSLLTEPDEV